MKRFVVAAAALVAMAALSACHDAGSKKNAAPEWVGTYAGTTPCADCPGIEMSITLAPDSTYSLSRKYVDRDAEPVVETGDIAWSDDGSTIILFNGDPNSTLLLKPSADALTQLDLEGNEITGDLAEMYVIKRVQK